MIVTLRRFISETLHESVRGEFDMRKFKALAGGDPEGSDFREAIEYASSRLQYLGRGFSRKAFVLNSRQVLKIDTETFGGQNEKELEVYTNPATKSIITKIFEVAPNNMWLIAELVRPLASKEEFQRLTGINWDSYAYAISPKWYFDRLSLAGKEEVEKAKASPPDTSTVADNPLFNASKSLIADSGIDPMDLVKLHHWGKTADGRVVLLDYGF